MATELVYNIQISSVGLVAIQRLDRVTNTLGADGSFQELDIEIIHGCRPRFVVVVSKQQTVVNVSWSQYDGSHGQRLPSRVVQEQHTTRHSL